MKNIEDLYKAYYQLSKAIEKERAKAFGFDEIHFEALIEELDDIDEEIQRRTR